MTIFHVSRVRISPLGFVLLVIASVGWGLNFPIMKRLLAEWPPLSSRGLCGIVGAVALALIAVLRQQSLRVPDKMRLHLVLVSMLTIGGWVAFMGIALLWLNASEAAVLGISIPVWVALLARPILGERLSLVRAVALAVALAGITVLIGGNGIDASVEKLPGIACALAGAVCVALGTVLLPSLIGDLATERATGLHDGVARLATLIGAPLGGVLIGLFGAQAVLVADAASFAFAALAIGWFVPARRPARRATATRPSYLSSLREGFGWLRRDRLTQGIGAMLFVTNLADQAVNAVLLPLWAAWFDRHRVTTPAR